MDMIFTKPMHLIGLSSFCYVTATLAMKHAASNFQPALLIAIVILLGIATACEIFVFRRTSMGGAYMSIIAVETLLVIGFAAVIGEGLTQREAVGAVLVLAGAAIVAA